MITWLLGENDFEIREALKNIETSFKGDVERVDGEDLELSGLPDIFMGMSLFARDRLVVVRGITANTVVWEKLPEWLPRISDNIHLVLVDPKADKRTSTYKAVKATADLHEFPAWGERDRTKASAWLQARAKGQGVNISTAVTKYIVDRVGVNQWELASALEVVSLLDEITIDSVDNIVPPNPQENVFDIFETALMGRLDRLAGQLRVLALQEDPYKFFGLLSSQVYSLAAVSFAEPGASPAKDFAVHPFVVSKMERHADRLGRARVARILELFAKTDADIKRSRGEPWLLIEQLLMGLI